MTVFMHSRNSPGESRQFQFQVHLQESRKSPGSSPRVQELSKELSKSPSPSPSLDMRVGGPF
jgi:hypothetical protein